MKKYILSLDEGTTSARAILFDKNANIVSMAQHEFPQIYPFPGWVEQDPMEIYANQYAALTECIAKSGVDISEIASVGITNQRETVIVWDKNSGRPICNAIVWQCRRTADICAELEKSEHAEYIQKTTGLKLDPYFSATKIKWILENVENAKELAKKGQLLAGTVDTWLVWKLTEGRIFVTDLTNASRTMLCNIHTGDWDDKLLDIFGIPRSMLPEIKSSSEIYGDFECMGGKLCIAGIAGDQQAALFGQGCFDNGDAKNTYGTGCFLLANTGEKAIKSDHGMLTTIAATEKGRPLQYALEGSVFVGGAIVRWLRDEMKMIHDSKDSEYFASKVSDCAGVYIVPAFAGLGAPYWDMNAKGSIFGLTSGAGKNHIIRAALEAIAFQTDDVLKAIEADISAINNENETKKNIINLRVDGGASQNDLLMQMQSDISDIDISRSANTEATALGAAFLAGLATGFFKNRQEIRSKLEKQKVFKPTMSEDERISKKDGWKRAVRACRTFSEL